MKDIADISKTLPKKEPAPEMEIINRPTKKEVVEESISPKPVMPENEEGSGHEIVPPKKVVEKVVVKEDTKSKEIIEGLESKIAKLENTIDKLQTMQQQLLENQEESRKSKHPFNDGATATNPSTGEKIVFSRGEWWKLDGEK